MPLWLVEFHRQWESARRRRVAVAVLPFSRDWEALLDAAGLRTAEDRKAAEREAVALEGEGRLVLVRHRYRKAILEKVRLPVRQEGWLRVMFDSPDPVGLRQESIGVVESAMRRVHPVEPFLWAEWGAAVKAGFLAGQSRRPLLWRQPEAVRFLMDLVFRLTARSWRPGTLVRDAAMELDLDSKALERHRGALEVLLGAFFQQPGRLGLEALNLMGSNSVLVFHGPLVLDLPEGVAEPSRLLEHASSVTAADLERASLRTTARAVLTVENSKSPFRQAVALNARADFLIVASSFPTRAVRLLLERLPAGLPHYHFGDTDAAGFFILQKLREVQPGRPVVAWQMEWQAKVGSPLLTEYDRRVAGRLLEDPGMVEVHGDLQRMLAAGRKGDFEQESRTLVLPGETG